MPCPTRPQQNEWVSTDRVEPIGYSGNFFVTATHPDGFQDKDQAIARLERAFKERDGQLTYLKVDPAFDEIRSDLRFQDLVRRKSVFRNQRANPHENADPDIPILKEAKRNIRRCNETGLGFCADGSEVFGNASIYRSGKSDFY